MLNRRFAGFHGLFIGTNEIVYFKKDYRNQGLDWCKGGEEHDDLSVLFRIFAVYIKLGRMNAIATLLALSLICFSAASATCDKQAIGSSSYQRAVKRVEALPEYKKWLSLVSATQGTHPASLPAVDRQIRRGHRCYWSVAAYEDQGTHLHLWQIFLVSQDGNHILVEDIEGNPMSLAKWRAGQHPGQNAP